MGKILTMAAKLAKYLLTHNILLICYEIRLIIQNMSDYFIDLWGLWSKLLN